MKTKIQRTGACLVCVLLLGLGFCAPGIGSALSTPEAPFDGEAPVWPNVRPVLILAGSDYQMGYQWYQQLVQIFGPWILEDMQGEWAEPFTAGELKALMTIEGYIRKHAPEMIDMFKGMADGATDAGVRLSYNQVLAQFSGIKSYPGLSHQSKWDKLKKQGCSGVVAWGSATTDGRLVVGASQNTSLEWDITLIALPEEGNSFIFGPFNPLGCHSAGWARPKLGAPAMNDKGLVYVREPDISSVPQAEWTYGLTEGAATLHTLRFANDAKQALDMMLGYESGDGLMGGTWADIHGNAWSIESRENPRVVRKPGDYGENDFIYFTNNALSHEAGDFREDARQGTIYVRHGGWCGPGTRGLSSVSRNLQIWNMFHYYHGNVDKEFVKMMWRFADDSNPAASPIIEMGLGEANADSYEMFNTVRLEKPIGGLHNGVVAVMVPDDLEYNVCQGPARRLTLKNPYAVDPLHSFIQLKLESSPAKIVSAAQSQAEYELIRAERELRKLNYSNSAYAPLKERFDQATIEWYNGLYYKKLAGRTTGNDSVYNWARALRSVTKCQAYAQYVYESLVSPPASPEDLGFKPWGYWLKSIR